MQSQHPDAEPSPVAAASGPGVALEGASNKDAVSHAPQLQMNAQSHHSLQMVQTKQDRDNKRGGPADHPFYETQHLPAYGQPRVRIAGEFLSKPAKKLSLS